MIRSDEEVRGVALNSAERVSPLWFVLAAAIVLTLRGKSNVEGFASAFHAL